MWKRGLLSCITIILILAFATSSGAIPADLTLQCQEGDLPCGFVHKELGREFICDNTGVFQDSSRQVGQVISCVPTDGSPKDKFLSDGDLWILCGNKEVSDTVVFDYIVQRVEYKLSTNEITDQVKDAFISSTQSSDQIVEVSGPNDVITGVAVNFADNEAENTKAKIRGLKIFVSTLNKDGSLTPTTPVEDGIAQYDLVVEAGPNQVVTGIAMRYDSFLNPLDNLLQLTVRNIDLETKELSDPIIRKAGDSGDIPELSITTDTNTQVLTKIGLSAFNPNIGDIDQGDQFRDIKKIVIGQRSIEPLIEKILDNQKSLTLTKDFTDVGDTFNPSPSTHIFYVEPTSKKNLVQLSFKQTEFKNFIAGSDNPSGNIFAKTTVSQSNAEKSFAEVGNPFTIPNSLTGDKEFACFTPDNINFNILSCAPTRDSFSTIQANVGDSFIGLVSVPQDNDRFYCQKNGQWTNSLGNIDDVNGDPAGEACTEAQDITDLRLTARDLEFTWTGSTCCGDNVDESFNDLSDKGTVQNPEQATITQRKAACFESNGVPHFTFLDTTDNTDVLVFNGTFQGCNIAAQNFIDGNQELLDKKDRFGSTLITDNEYCQTFTDTVNGASKTLYCSFEETWKNDAKTEEEMFLRTIRFPEEKSFTSNSECCVIDQCWTGNSCQPHGSIAPSAEEFFCFRGLWKKQNEDIFKYTPKRDARSLNCRQDQCFAKKSAQAGSFPQPAFEGCVDEGYFLNDFICQEGDWQSRTQAISETLLKAASSDFSLYCDEPEQVLNYITYDFLSNPEQKFEVGTVDTNFISTISDPTLCNGNETNVINNVCVLNNGNNVIFGVSLNCPVTMPKNNILEVFRKDGSHCTDTEDNIDGYELCNTPKSIYKKGFAYHNPTLNTLLFSPEAIDQKIASISACPVTGSFSFLDIFNTYNSLCWVDLLTQAFTRPDTPALLETFSTQVADIENFQKIFFSKKGEKSIFGAMELNLFDWSSGVAISTNYLGIFYDNFAGDVCRLVDDLIGFTSEDFNCKRQGTIVEVTAADQSPTRRHLFKQEVWNELTVKTRIKEIPITQCFPDGCNNNVPLKCGLDKDLTDTAVDPDFDNGNPSTQSTATRQCLATESLRCDDGEDNDGNGATDACDSVCGIVDTNVTSQNFEEFKEISCNDGFDNDCDGDINTKDSDCQPLTTSLPLISMGKGDRLTITVTTAEGQDATSPDYTWEIIEQTPNTGTDKVCGLQITDSSNPSIIETEQTSEDNIEIEGFRSGTCKVKVTDNRGLSSISELVTVKPATLKCEYQPSSCQDPLSTTVLKLSKKTNALSSVPDSNNGPRICCRLSSGATLFTTMNEQADSDHYASLTSSQNAKLIVTPDAVSNDVELYLNAGDEKITCTPIRSDQSGTGTSIGDPTNSLPISNNCPSSGFDTCLYSTNHATEGLATDCDSVDDFPIKMCCRVEGNQQSDGCTEFESKCKDFNTLQVCVGGVFQDQACGFCLANPNGQDNCLFLPLIP